MLRANSRFLRVVGRSCSIRSSHNVVVNVGEGEPLQLTTGGMARFAAGSVVASQGDNSVLATCVYRQNSGAGQGFLPLTVDYRQSAAAIGKIPTNYLRRELGQTDNDIIASRIIDRTLRPLFPKGWNSETQLVCKPLSLDDQGDGVLLAVNAAAAALHTSPVPFDGPVGAVRIGYVDGKVLINPTVAARRESKLDMILAGCSDRRTVMVEMDGKEIPMDEMENIFDVGLTSINEILTAMDQLRTEAGKTKAKFSASADFPPEMVTQIEDLAAERLYYILTDVTHDKTSRDEAVKALGSDIAQSFPGTDLAGFWPVYSEVVKNTLRQLILDSNIRCDGRGIHDFRPIKIDVDVYKKLHGSALFQRGQTQVFSTVTFDSPAAAFHPDSISQMLGAQRKKMFMLHYEFPAFAVNEIATGRGANRREIGHGALAEKALKHVIPKQFPYSIRLATQVLESNGSSSMAAVCSGSLAMFDAGVPLEAPVAGVAIGLVTGKEDPAKKYKVLTDIMGMEDYAGDMDFKIAGSSKGFTAIQLDVKIAGLTRDQLRESLQRGQAGVDYVLQKMAAERDRPRPEFKPTVPVIENIRLEIYKRQALFRSGGLNAKLIEAETGVKVTIEDDNYISLFAPNKQRLAEAKELMTKVLSEGEERQYTFGQMIHAEIVEMLDKGVRVRLQDSVQPIFVPNQQLHHIPVQHSSATGLKLGEKIIVQWLGRDSVTGQIRLSRRTALATALPTRTIRPKK